MVEIDALRFWVAFGSLGALFLAQSVAMGFWAGKISGSVSRMEERWWEIIPDIREQQSRHSEILSAQERGFESIQDRLDRLMETKGELEPLWRRIDQEEEKRQEIFERLISVEEQVKIRPTGEGD